MNTQIYSGLLTWQGHACIIPFCLPSYPGGGDCLGPDSSLAEDADARGAAPGQLQAETLGLEEAWESREERSLRSLSLQCGQDQQLITLKDWGGGIGGRGGAKYSAV